MATCVVCEEEYPSTATLDCQNCERAYCREHYHGHDCEPVKIEPERSDQEDKTMNVGEEASSSALSSGSTIGYGIAMFGGIIGTYYLAESMGNLSAVLTGEGLVNAVEAIVQMVAASAFFAFGTFVMVAVYIFIDDR